MSASRTNLEEVRAIAANYFFWQGLRWIPIGVALIVVAVDLLAKDFFGPLGLLVGMLSLVVAFWMSTTGLRGYYRRNFGRVRADPDLHARRESIKWMVVYPAMMASTIFDLKLSLPIVISGFVWAISLEAYRRSTGGGRVHYVVAAAALCIFGLLPLGGSVPTGKDGVAVLVGFFGLIYVIGGILDHRELVRVMGRAAD
jgi:hypothetical protein